MYELSTLRHAVLVMIPQLCGSLQGFALFHIIMMLYITGRLFRAQEPKAPVTYCDHALSGVCRPSSVVRLSSVVRRPLDYLHFRLLLQNPLMDFDETWYG